MASLNEVMAEMGYLEDSVQFNIDEDMRTIAVPADGVIAGVVGDKNINRINFRMPRYYNGFDMSTFETRINYVNAQGLGNYYTVTDVTVSEDKILFTWLVDSDVTAAKGTVNFVVKMLKTANGVVTQSFSTAIANIRVIEGLEVTDQVTPEAITDILNKLKADVDTYLEESVPESYDNLANEVTQARVAVNGMIHPNLKARLDQNETDILLVSKKATANSEQMAVLKAKSIEDMTDVEKMYALPNGEMYVYDVNENLADPTSSEWCTNARLATVYGNSKECTGSILTNYIPVKVGDILRVKGLNLFGNNSTHNSTIASYSSKDIIADGTGKLEAYLMYKITSLNVEQSIDGVKNVISQDGDTYVYTIFERGDGTQVSYATDIAYIRISAPLAEGYTAENVVITVSEGWKSVHKALENKVEDDISRKIDKNQGIENVGKILVVGADGNIILADMPNGGSNGDVTGYLDTDNNIRLSGNLASGRYTLKYEYEDGTVAEVGTIEVGAIPEPTEPTNFADTSSSDWLTDYRLSFNGTELTTKELTGAICTNFVADIQTDDIVRVEGIDFTDTNNRQALVKENGTIIAVDNAMNLPGYSTHITNVTYDSNTLQFTVANTEQLKKLRFSGTLTGTADDVKITITRNGTVL